MSGNPLLIVQRGVDRVMVCFYEKVPCICYVQSSDWDNPRTILCKFRIRVLLGQFPDCPRACPHTTNVVHMYVGLYILVGEWRLTKLSRSGWKKPSYPEESRKQGIIIIKQGDNWLSIKTLFLAPLYVDVHFLAWSKVDHDFFAVLFLVCPLLAKFPAYCMFLTDRLLAYNTVRW